MDSCYRWDWAEEAAVPSAAAVAEQKLGSCGQMGSFPCVGVEEVVVLIVVGRLVTVRKGCH